jgi:hypothetical protein
MADDTESSRTTSVCLPLFDGQHKNYQIWWTRCMAYASVHQFTQALKTGGEAAMPASDEVTVDVTTHPQVAKAKKRNAIAMANLTMAFTREMTMGLVYKAQTEEWPEGLAYLVVAALKAKYMPDDVITKVELRQMLAKVKMKKDDEPSIIFEQLSAIENRFNKPGQQIPDDDLIAAVLTAAPKDYVSILTAEQRSKGTALRLTDLESAMTQHWRQTTGTLSTAEEGNEVTLLGFNGICYNCQKPGYRADECPEKANRNPGGRNNNNNNRNFSRGGRGRGNGGNKNFKFKGNCNKCGKQGHAEATCWILPSNASKRPTWFKPREDGTETGAVATETGNKVESLLMAMEFPTDQKLATSDGGVIPSPRTPSPQSAASSRHCANFSNSSKRRFTSRALGRHSLDRSGRPMLI